MHKEKEKQQLIDEIRRLGFNIDLEIDKLVEEEEE